MLKVSKVRACYVALQSSIPVTPAVKADEQEEGDEMEDEECISVLDSAGCSCHDTNETNKGIRNEDTI